MTKENVTRYDGLLDSNKKYIKSQAKKRAEAKKKVSRKKKVKTLKAMADSKSLQKSYAKKLVSKTSVGIQAQLIATEFFNMGTINVGEPLIYTLDEPVDRAEIMEVSVYGGTPRETIIEDADIVRVHPYQITSPEVSMSKFSLRQGDISNEQKMRKRVKDGMADETDKDSWSLLRAGLFTDITNVQGINIDDRVQEYPTSNTLDLSSQGGLTLEIFKQIAKHFDLLGRRIRNIYIPASRRSDLYDWLSIPSGYSDGSGVTADSVVPSSLHEQVIRTGQLNNIFGYPVNLVPVNTLNGTAGADDPVEIWINTDQPAGEYREIPKFSDTYREEDAKRIYFTMNKAVAMFQTPNNRLNYLNATIDSV